MWGLFGRCKALNRRRSEFFYIRPLRLSFQGCSFAVCMAQRRIVCLHGCRGIFSGQTAHDAVFYLALLGFCARFAVDKFRVLGLFGGERGAVGFEDFLKAADEGTARFDAFGYGAFGTGEGFEEGAEAGGVYRWGWDGFGGVGEFVVLGVCGCGEADGGSYCF